MRGFRSVRSPRGRPPPRRRRSPPPRRWWGPPPPRRRRNKARPDKDARSHEDTGPKERAPNEAMSKEGMRSHETRPNEATVEPRADEAAMEATMKASTSTTLLSRGGGRSQDSYHQDYREQGDTSGTRHGVPPPYSRLTLTPCPRKDAPRRSLRTSTNGETLGSSFWPEHL